MAKAKKDWVSKLHNSHCLPKVEKIREKMIKNWGSGTVAIPAPIEVDELMREVPKGKVTTINAIRQAIAKKHKATIGCPITCGIFAWIAAHASEQQRGEGKKQITPWWRTLKSDGSLNEKYPGDIMFQKELLEHEGQKVEKIRKKYLVLDFEKKLKEW